MKIQITSKSRCKRVIIKTPNPMPTLKDQAIQNALDNKWNEAILANEELLKENPREIDTLNRLAYAFMQSNQFSDAKKTYSKVIDLDRTNPIATKNLKKLIALSAQKNGIQTSSNHINHMDNVFIQEAGKTKTVELTNVADKKTLMALQHGDDVFLKDQKFLFLTRKKHS
jgi:tetratricopeptide (TPR) repeat protein